MGQRRRCRSRRSVLTGLVVIMGLPMLPTILLSTGPAAAHPARSWTAYVANNGQIVTPIDTATGHSGTPISFSDDTDSVPVAITPDGETAYVGFLENSPGDSVATIDTATNTIGNQFVPGGVAPDAIAITPNGATAYVAGGEEVTPIDTATETTIGEGIPVGIGANGIAITPNGATAYVTIGSDNVVTLIDTATNRVETSIPVGTQPAGIAITPNGATAYVANSLDDTVTPIDLTSNIAGTPIPVGTRPASIAITPNGATAYVTNSGDMTVTPIHTATNTAGTAIPIPDQSSADAIAISPNGATAYVVGGLDVVPIDTATNTVEGPISVPSGAYNGIAITPDQAPDARLSVSPAEAGKPTGFDASASTVAIGSISSYAWNFGDGSMATTSAPTTAHTYTTPKSYTASVTETDSAGTSTTQVFTGQTMSRNGGPSAVASQSFTVVSPLTITTTTVPPGHLGVSYATTLQADGGNPPYKWSIVSGGLPSGLRLHSKAGVISGRPTEDGMNRPGNPGGSFP
jgi:YVTN family beta-propeller protein